MFHLKVITPSCWLVYCTPLGWKLTNFLAKFVSNQLSTIGRSATAFKSASAVRFSDQSASSKVRRRLIDNGRSSNRVRPTEAFDFSLQELAPCQKLTKNKKRRNLTGEGENEECPF